jgi:hypothetical protein
MCLRVFEHFDYMCVCVYIYVYIYIIFLYTISWSEYWKRTSIYFLGEWVESSLQTTTYTGMPYKEMCETLGLAIVFSVETLIYF